MNKEYELWKSKIKDESHLKYLNNLSDDEINKLFSSKLEFGTGGLRAVMGISPCLLNIYTIFNVTSGFAKYLKSKYDGEINVVIGHDPRDNSRLFSNVASSCLIQNGITVHQFDELIPTPVLSFAVRQLEAKGGIMITASHNPIEYNGYKVYDESGSQLNLDDAQSLINFINSTPFEFDFEIDTTKQKIINQSLIETYYENICTKSTQNDLKIVFSPLHGTSYKLGVEALKRSGFNNLITVENQMTPDSKFTNTKSVNPEEKLSFEEVEKYLLKNDYEIGLVTDPDADRLGLCVNENGVITYYTGNQTGTLLIKYLIDSNNYNSDSIIYKTIVTGEMGAILAKDKNIAVEETLTGFKFIGEKIRNLKDKKFLFGYEESYGYLFNECVRDKDAISALVQISNMVQYYKNKGLKLSEVMDQVYKQVGYYSEITYSFACDNQSKIQNVMKMYRNLDHNCLFGYEVSHKIDYEFDDTDVAKADVLKFYLKDFGWVVFRPSGTEPKIKMYVCIKSNSIDEANQISQEMKMQFDDVLLNI